MVIFQTVKVVFLIFCEMFNYISITEDADHPTWVHYVVYISHFLLTFNHGVNFWIYYFKKRMFLNQGKLNDIVLKVIKAFVLYFYHV